MMMLSCEAPQLAINVLQTASCCRIRGSYQHEPIPSHCKSDLKEYLPEWCARPTASYRLIAAAADKVFKLGSEKFVTVGRNASAKVVLSSLSVSRMHAAFMHDSLNQTFLVDLGSTHGTFIGSEQLTPYTPTLVTKKSLIRFGTCEVQYLLAVVCPEECIAREAMRKEDEAERDLYLNTQLNLINVLPVGAGNDLDDTDLSFSRVDTFNFVHSLKNPVLKRVQASCESVATCGEEAGLISVNTEQPQHVQFSAFENTVSEFQSPMSKLHVSVDEPFRFEGNRADDVVMPMADVGMSISLTNSPELADSPELPGRSFIKSNIFVFPGNVHGEPSVKRCASTAGVDDSDESDFALCDGIVDEMRSRRRRMSEDPNDYGSYDSGRYDSGRSMSLSIESGGEIASIGGSSNGFISSGSMSECEEGEEPVDKKFRKVRFSDFHLEIPELYVDEL